MSKVAEDDEDNRKARREQKTIDGSLLTLVEFGEGAREKPLFAGGDDETTARGDQVSSQSKQNARVFVVGIGQGGRRRGGRE